MWPFSISRGEANLNNLDIPQLSLRTRGSHGNCTIHAYLPAPSSHHEDAEMHISSRPRGANQCLGFRVKLAYLIVAYVCRRKERLSCDISYLETTPKLRFRHYGTTT